MTISIEAGDKDDDKAIPKSIPMGRKSVAEDPILTPNSSSASKHVVIVMDALKEFSMEPLQWALDNVVGPGDIVTLLGVMPWLNFLHLWTLDLQDLPALKERSEWKNDAKYQKIRGIIELCDKYGVVSYMKVTMGYPLRLLVLEQTMSLHATWVVFDKNHRKHRAFYAKRMPCNVVMMNSDGEGEMLKVRSMIDNGGELTPVESPALNPLVPKVIISEKLMEILRPREQEKQAEEKSSSIKVDDDDGRTIPRSILMGKRLFDLVLRDSPNLSSASYKHVVIVMDALKEFSMEPLQWTLDHVAGPGSVVTLLGVMPWVNFLLSCKIWLDVWTLDLENLQALKERSEWNSDTKCQKIRGIIQLCDKYGVAPCMKVAMGNSLRLVVLEQTTTLHATWVVFDRHHRKNRAFYAKRIPCNVVMMNNDGEVDMLKVRPMIDNGKITPEESPASLAPVPEVIISEQLMEILRPREQEKEGSR